jgi:hypothetical protein
MTEELPDICLCDVTDKQRLAVFRHKRSEWRDALIGKDPHSIENQIIDILWQDAIFRTVNEARRLFVEAPHDRKGFNRDVIDLLDKGFVVSQIMAIRRLTEPGFPDPKKAVISITPLLADMERQRELLTREHYVCYDGSPFEYPPDKTDNPEYFHWRIRQDNFDRLSGKNNKARQRQDGVDGNLFPKLRKSLGACDDFRAYANKLVAHASAPSAKRDQIKKERRITLSKFDAAYRAIVQVASFLSTVFLYEHSLGQMPTPQYDHLENLDKPMILKREYGALSEYWHKRVQEVEQWSSKFWPN